MQYCNRLNKDLKMAHIKIKSLKKGRVLWPGRNLPLAPTWSSLHPLSFPLFSQGDTCIVGIALLASVGSSKPLAHWILSRRAWTMLLPQTPMFSGSNAHLPVVCMCGSNRGRPLVPCSGLWFFFTYNISRRSVPIISRSTAPPLFRGVIFTEHAIHHLKADDSGGT